MISLSPSVVICVVVVVVMGSGMERRPWDFGDDSRRRPQTTRKTTTTMIPRPLAVDAPNCCWLARWDSRSRPLAHTESSDLQRGTRRVKKRPPAMLYSIYLPSSMIELCPEPPPEAPDPALAGNMGDTSSGSYPVMCSSTL